MCLASPRGDQRVVSGERGMQPSSNKKGKQMLHLCLVQLGTSPCWCSQRPIDRHATARGEESRVDTANLLATSGAATTPWH